MPRQIFTQQAPQELPDEGSRQSRQVKACAPDMQICTCTCLLWRRHARRTERKDSPAFASSARPHDAALTLALTIVAVTLVGASSIADVSAEGRWLSGGFAAGDSEIASNEWDLSGSLQLESSSSSEEAEAERSQGRRREEGQDNATESFLATREVPALSVVESVGNEAHLHRYHPSHLAGSRGDRQGG